MGFALSATIITVVLAHYIKVILLLLQLSLLMLLFLQVAHFLMKESKAAKLLTNIV